MAIDYNKLNSSVLDSSNIDLSDDDLAKKLSTAIITPRITPITFTTCGSVWGPIAAATFRATLKAAINQGGQMGALVDYAFGILDGVGFDASDPQALGVAQQFAQAGLCTIDQINGVFGSTSYICGDIIQTSDITTIRQQINFQQLVNNLQQWLIDKQTQAFSLISNSTSIDNLPTKDDLQKVYSGG